MFAKRAAVALLAYLGAAPFAIAGSCAGPQPLEFRIRFHPDAANYEELGKWFGDRKQYACAIESFHAGLAIEPDSGELSYLLGLTLYVTGDAKSAIAPLRQSIQTQPKFIQAHLILAAAFSDLHSRDNAKAEYAAALRLDPRSNTALEGLSKLLLADGDSIAVIDLLRSAPLDETLTLDLAQAYDKARMLDKAAQILTSALRTNPSSVRLTNALATVYVNQTLYPEALRLAEKCVRLHPDSLEAQDLYLHLLVVNHQLDSARGLAKKLLAAHPHDFEALYLSGILERVEGNYSAARQHLEEAVELNPTHFNARYNLGVVLADLKDAAGAKEQLEKALALGAGATEPQVRYRLSMVLRTLGEDEEAERQSDLTQKELQAVEDNTLAYHKSEEAEAALKAGDPDKAVSLYREAVDATPNDPLLNYKWSMALDRAGDMETEQMALEKVVKLDPTFALAHYQIGYLASRSGDFTSAEAHFRQAVRAAPGYADAWLSLAATLGEETRYPEALTAVANAIKLDPKNEQALQLRQELRQLQNRH